MGWKHQYPHISILASLKPNPRILLGKRLLWTLKEDGECVAIWWNENPYSHERWIQISSRNQEDSQNDIKQRVMGCQEWEKIVQLLTEYPQFVVYVEECQEGRSVTGVKTYERNILFLFDIFDTSSNTFLHYTAVYQHGFHLGIPVVKLYAETRHRTMKDLYKYEQFILDYCHSVREEGMVIKTYGVPDRFKNWGEFKGDMIQAKVKIDVPEAVKKKIVSGEPILPPIPENEIFGTINKVHQDLGDENFKKKEIAMPLIAKSVGEECAKHLYSKPKENLFSLYNEYIERMIIEKEKNDEDITTTTQ